MAEDPSHSPSWHSSKWYTNHPKVPRPAPPQKSPVDPAPVSIGLWIPRAGGFSLLGGFGLMRVYFWPGIAAVYISMVLLVWAFCFDPLFVKGRLGVQIVGIGLVVILFDVVTIGIVGASAPLELYSYAMRKGNQADGVDVGGIKWNSHFTELRIAVTNPSDEDYRDLDVILQPDRWTYEAVILNRPSTCDLTPIADMKLAVGKAKQTGTMNLTITRSGNEVDVHDTQGNEYTTVAYPQGYRLLCSRLPANYTLQTVFALVAAKPDILEKTKLPTVPQGGVGGAMSEWPDMKSQFDFFDVRPFPLSASIKGKYGKNLKTYSIAKTIKVGDGD